MADQPFDVEAFLARPLVARLATAGPAVRPVWYLWEDGSFWILVGPWNRIPADVAADPGVAVVVDSCDLRTGECLQVLGHGVGTLEPFTPDRGARMLERYLGTVPEAWDVRFRSYLTDAPEARWLQIEPTSLSARDLSFTPSRPR